MNDPYDLHYLATSNSESSDSESEKDKTVKENETGELTKEVLSELKMEEKPLLTGKFNFYNTLLSRSSKPL